MTSERQKLRTRARLATTLLTVMFIVGLVLYVSHEAPWKYVGLVLLAVAFSTSAGLACEVATR